MDISIEEVHIGWDVSKANREVDHSRGNYCKLAVKLCRFASFILYRPTPQ